MSRSALWRQEANTKERERQSQQTFTSLLEEGRNRNIKGQIPIFGNDSTFNMNPMLLSNISSSPYFSKCCGELHDWNSVVDEIYYEVTHMEPWSDGANKSPSTAFCLLLRFFTLRLTEKQMWTIVQHPDSPYIRCTGFLYLRYVADPNTLYSKWFQPFLYDTEPVEISKSKKNLKTVGDYVRFLLNEMNYFGTLLPRLPVSVQRDVQVKLVMEEEIFNRARYHASNPKAMEYFKTIGSRVQALYGDEDNPIAWYDAVIDRVLLPATNDASYDTLHPKFIVTFPEYGNTETVTLGELVMPHDSYQNCNRYNQDSIMDRVRRQERDGVTNANRNQYAKRPMTYKGSLATSSSSSSRETRGYNSSTSSNQNNKRPVANNAEANNASSKQDYREVQEKKRKLMDKYG